MKAFPKIARKVFLIFAVLFALDFIGILGLSYPSWRVNQPLKNPIKIAEIRNDSLVLEDGRTILLSSASESSIHLQGKTVLSFFSERPHEVEIEKTTPGVVQIKVADRRRICGTPWLRLINLPLIPSSIDKYQTRVLAFGVESELIHSNREQSGGGNSAAPRNSP